ncbi:ectoine/hydroxyectoine ABC transporter substrate-binding protein EhuB [Massilia sp. FT127W]|uniref:Ectoine/hydroxyectoine ABC transporter substrate-binding protein EhuB n=1 Tax=Pseudoduganella aquatica TaxID=2660641 RepID=A0A7X4HBS0_9BURK|nr:ectoine/hydroxyectoine ABC transporter substrate-binding protein EhuB [Pseudoduganella aquatica]
MYCLLRWPRPLAPGARNHIHICHHLCLCAAGTEILSRLNKLGAILLAAMMLANAARAETTLERIVRTGVLRLGYVDEAPFAYLLPDGTLTGESAVIATEVLGRLGAQRIEPVAATWESLIPGLLAGRYDMAAGALTITPELSNTVLFSNPHYRLGDTLLVVRSNPRQLRSYGDIAADRRLRLAVVTGSAQYDYALDAGMSAHQLLSVQNSQAQLQAVRTGRAAAAAGSELSMRRLAQRDPARVQALAVFADDPVHAGYGAFAFRPEDATLCDAVNRALKGWLGSAEHLRLVAPFGFGPLHVTTRTAAEVVARAAP